MASSHKHGGFLQLRKRANLRTAEWSSLLAPSSGAPFSGSLENPSSYNGLYVQEFIRLLWYMHFLAYLQQRFQRIWRRAFRTRGAWKSESESESQLEGGIRHRLTPISILSAIARHLATLPMTYLIRYTMHRYPLEKRGLQANRNVQQSSWFSQSCSIRQAAVGLAFFPSMRSADGFTRLKLAHVVFHD